MAIDYVDFLMLHGQMYLAGSQQQPHAKIGPVIARVRCNINNVTSDGRHTVAGPFRDGDAAFLPVGTAIHSVAHYSDHCRVAAVVNGRTVMYAAQYEVDHHTADRPCAAR